MRITYLVLIFLALSFLGFSQTISLADKAKSLQHRILTNHVLVSEWNDSLSLRVNTLFLDFLDPNYVLFSEEKRNEFNQLASSQLTADISDRKTSYFDQVSIAYREELRLFVAFLNKQTFTLKNEKEPKIAYSFESFEKNARIQDRRLKFSQKQLFEQLFLMHSDKDLITDELILKDFPKAKEKIIQKWTEIQKLMTEDNKMLEDYFLQSIAQSVDPHSLYFTESMMKSFKDELSTDQERFGFGYGLDANNQVVITSLLPGSAAWLSGKINENDLLIEIGLYRNKSWEFIPVSSGLIGLNQLQNLLGSYKEREIQLVLSNSETPKNKVHLFKYKVLNDNELVKNLILGTETKIGYIQLSDFYTDFTGSNSGNGCANDLAKCILKLQKDQIKGLILDLRGNGGGSLKEAIELTGIFIDYGPVLGISDKSGVVSVLKDANRGYIYDGPLLILIDENSASASEVVAGALQDYGKALVIGTPSFGKATSQQIIPIDPLAINNGYQFVSGNHQFGYVNITEGILYRITSQSNQLTGVQPDIFFDPLSLMDKSEREKDLLFPIQAPAITKKMIFTASTTLPKSALMQKAKDYSSTPEMKKYQEIGKELELLIEASDYFFQDYLTFFNTNIRIDHKAKAWKDQKNSYFQPEQVRSNSFDQELYTKNDILRTFQQEFTHEISNDITVKFAWDLMNQWVLIQNK